MEGKILKTLFDVEWQFESYIFQNHEWIVEFPKSWHLPVLGSVGYLGFVYFGQKFMEKRPRFQLRIPMFAWSAVLAMFSWLAVARACVKVWSFLYIYGFRDTVCITTPTLSTPVMRFWALAMVYSKYAEFGDTVFLVLRKQHLSFLHWYHHLTVALFAWFVYSHQQIPGIYIFCGMNFVVHGVMYTYYASKAARINTPKIFAIFVTFLQITQMLCGCATVCGMVYWGNDPDCTSTVTQRTFSLILYVSYLILFLNFFFQAYIRSKLTKEATDNAIETTIRKNNNKNQAPAFRSKDIHEKTN